MPQPRAFLINVGVNASHGDLRSPLYDDGTFTFVPIPEGPQSESFDCIPRYRDILPPRALACVPPKYHEWRAHHDPEFDTFTYGDHPQTSRKAALLKKVMAGDHMLFLARLVRWHGDDLGWGEAGFYIIGYLVLEEVVWDVRTGTPKDEVQTMRRNAHVRRLDTPLGEPGTAVFRGSSESRLLTKPLRFDRELADRVMRAASGRPWEWRPGRSELQTIGSYTRSVRMIDDAERAAMLIREASQRPSSTEQVCRTGDGSVPGHGIACCLPPYSRRMSKSS